jgi:5-methylcytosine-specific restriction endonuclease McrA
MNAHPPALVLNADYQPLSYFPLSTIGWQDAVKAVWEDTHVVVREYDQVVRSPSIEMRLPSVLMVRNYVKAPKRVAFTRFNVFLRDGFCCQYCGQKHDELTFDHVIPRAAGGRTRWDNIVAACGPCNSKKDCDTAMRPRRMPHEPDAGEMMKAQRAFPPRYLHETWIDFLYWDSVLEDDVP